MVSGLTPFPLSFSDYTGDRQLRRAVEREFEIIGEALNRLTRADPAAASRFEALNRIVAFRNRIIHGYGVRGIPTEALETWMVKGVSGPDHRPDDLDVFYDEGAPSPHAVPPPGELPPPAVAPVPDPLPFDRRVMERRQRERRRSDGHG